ncbi:ATP-binding cassette domain-containing protein [Paraburkholderia sp. BL10I2N1]|uniref:ABC transporter ATP-binding protein n=1 Tax=Paraburkholderia sp. BL10I2N1 TaxID=1938796 RepID=UPI00106019C6|nr:ATP-binding cassette domain-containing protein [Paraburkholderia sp. BL10I2N1]TDN57857.1 putative ABC transport system ATP-binding protein/lipoprotein-releasing system ATP-binding protein [Paraburkholderia sp. BL10I2N1]
MPDVLVRGIDVTRRFQHGNVRVDALQPASFAVRGGDRIAIVGPSGSGKSTLLHLIADLDRPSSGELTWPALGLPGTLRPACIGIVFQAPSLLPALSAVENVELLLRLTGRMSSPRRTAMRALHAVGLGTVAGKYPDELSGGQAQRIAVARAIVLQPKLVLADEPTGQLDQRTAQETVDALLAAVEGTGTAMVLATHDPSIAQRMSLTWHIEHGRLRTPDTDCGPAAPGSDPNASVKVRR